MCVKLPCERVECSSFEFANLRCYKINDRLKDALQKIQAATQETSKGIENSCNVNGHRTKQARATIASVGSAPSTPSFVSNPRVCVTTNLNAMILTQEIPKRSQFGGQQPRPTRKCAHLIVRVSHGIKFQVYVANRRNSRLCFSDRISFQLCLFLS